MTTLNIGTLQINNPYLENMAMNEIRALLTQFLESDLLSNMTIKRKNRWDKIDAELRSLKVTNRESAQELGEALTILAQEAQISGYSDHKMAKDEYLAHKYNL